MPPHPRQLIRHAVVQLLKDKNVNAGKIDRTRAFAYKAGQVPGVSVYTMSDVVDTDSLDSARRVREIKLEIEGWVSAGAGVAVDDAMDDLAAAIEAAMASDPTLSGLAIDVALNDTTLGLVETGDSLLGLVELEYLVTYQHSAFVVPGDLADFRTVDATYRPAGHHESDDVHDRFDVQEAPSP